MVKHSVKVFARLKREKNSKNLNEYEIIRRESSEDLEIVARDVQSFMKSTLNKFRFHKVFDRHSTQDEVFESVAKPVVNSTLHGYNGTIFAYGQTGSGKTYAITGSSVDYNDRGIIPRAIQHIFQFTSKSPDRYTIYISYLEIYKDVGYDLLNPKQSASKLEELPRVMLLEDAKGESHLRNLNVFPVGSEQDAMRLLFLGDTNRTIAETPLNKYSSRSHCIFTIYISTLVNSSGVIRKSKLHLVDLAGSERVHKSKIAGVTLVEAKHINLSLHYLEQVILALSQSKRSHIPFRNSMMTYMLRDSLIGNCLTVMLATLTLRPQNFEETISTCKFAQRVALMNTEAKINEEVDPQQEIRMLREEAAALRQQLSILKGNQITEKLTKEEEKECKSCVRKYLNNESSELSVGSDMRKIKYCFKVMKQAVLLQQNQKLAAREKENQVRVTTAASYEKIVKEKDDMIQALQDMLKRESDYNKAYSFDNHLFWPDTKMEAFEDFMSDTKNSNEVDYYNQQLHRKYEIAKAYAETIEKCQENIVSLKNGIEVNKYNELVRQKLMAQLVNQQNVYKDAIMQLETLKKEVEHLKHGLDQAKMRVVRKFNEHENEENAKSCALSENKRLYNSNETYSSKPDMLDFAMEVKEEFPEVDKKEEGMLNCFPARCKTPIIDNEPQLQDSSFSENNSDNSTAEEEHVSLDMRNDSNQTKAGTENINTYFNPTDSQDFINFMKTVPLTGDPEIDEEIFNFYRGKFS